MIGDAYFALRAQIGTALFSLGRLAAEVAADEKILVELRTAQVALRERFLWLVTSVAGSGYPLVLNPLFEREFCGEGEPAAKGRTVVFDYATTAAEKVLGTGIVEFRRPYTFLRDFAIVDAPAEAATAALAPFVMDAEVIFFIVRVSQSVDDAMRAAFGRLGTAALARTVVVLLAKEAVLPGVAEEAIRQWKQKMRREAPLECPAFVVSPAVPGGMVNLERYLNEEVILSPLRHSRLRRFVDRARVILGELAGQPEARHVDWPREAARLRETKEILAEREGQAQRQTAGSLWQLTRSFEDLQEQSQRKLRRQLPLASVIAGRWSAADEFTSGFEKRANESWRGQLEDLLLIVASDAEASTKSTGEAARDQADDPIFPRQELLKSAESLHNPLELKTILTGDIARAGQVIRWPLLGLVVVLFVAAGLWRHLGSPLVAIALAVGAVVGMVWLIVGARRSVVKKFGRHFADNRAAFFGAFEPLLAAAVAKFYNDLSAPLERRSLELAAERETVEPLLTRLKQLEEVLEKCAGELDGGGVKETSNGKDQ